MVLIKQAKIIAPGSANHQQIRDILIEKGQITQIAQTIKADDAQQIAVDNLHVSPGWFDTWVQVGDPGFEHREDLDSIVATAAAGGFTAITCLPNTQPVIESKSQVLYIKNRTQYAPIEVYPIGAISEHAAGKDITEIYDMQAAGAIAFSDGKNAMQDGGLLMRSLQYVKKFNGLIINHPFSRSVAAGGQLHEGAVSTMLGIKGVPSLAEELMVVRDIYLAEYTDSRLHIANISTERSVDLIRQAKEKGIKITASVAILNLLHTDQDLLEFNSNLKVSPPLRSEEDRQALIRGVKDGIIDMITSNHVPVEEEGKKLEFAYATSGAIGLQTAFAALREIDLSLDTIINALAIRPREIFGIATAVVETNATANLTLFQPNRKWTFRPSDNLSKSANTSLLNRSFNGSVLGIIKGENIVIRD
ncbi:MAG: dihydroorotase family protein [Saprospiraceae bacterium]